MPSPAIGNRRRATLVRTRTQALLCALAACAPAGGAAFATELATATVHAGLPDHVRLVDADAPPGGDGLTWQTAFNDLQDALMGTFPVGGIVPEVREVWVAEGTYVPSVAVGPADNVSFLVLPGVEVYGGFSGSETARDQRDPDANITVLSGDQNGDDDPLDPSTLGDNTRVVEVIGVPSNPTNDPAVLEGLVISGGSSPPEVNRFGGAMLVRGYIGRDIAPGSPLVLVPANLVVRDCVFASNTAERVGGAVVIDAESRNGSFPAAPLSTALFEDCRFEGNRAGLRGGAIWAYGMRLLEVRGCSLVDNRAGDSPLAPGNAFDALGGAIAVEAMEAATIEETRFINNTVRGIDRAEGGAVHSEISIDIRVRNSVFSGNKAESLGGPDAAKGGGFAVSSIATFDPDARVLLGGCEMTDNTAQLGGAVWADVFVKSLPLDIELAHCTIVANHADSAGGVWLIEGDVSDSIVFDNTDLDPKTPTADAQVRTAGVARRSLIEGLPSEADANGTSGLAPIFQRLGPQAGTPGATRDLSIRPGSPSIDAGSSQAAEDAGLLVDVLGQPRSLDDAGTPDNPGGPGTGPVADIGAREFAGQTTACAIADLNADGSTGPSDFTDWLAAFQAGERRADQNLDGGVNPDDFTAWLARFTGACQ